MEKDKGSINKNKDLKINTSICSSIKEDNKIIVKTDNDVITCNNIELINNGEIKKLRLENCKYNDKKYNIIYITCTKYTNDFS